LLFVDRVIDSFLFRENQPIVLGGIENADLGLQIERLPAIGTLNE
jgi:hypothetical protein